MNKYKLYSVENPNLEQLILNNGTPTECPNGDTLNLNAITVLEDNVRVSDGIYVDSAVSLDNYKLLKNNAIDDKTGELISAGYTYASKQFSLSANAQTNILALFATKDNPALTYPIEYNTLDDTDNYMVTDATDLENMYLTALATKKASVDSGTLLKDQVRASTTRAQVDAVIDNR